MAKRAKNPTVDQVMTMLFERMQKGSELPIEKACFDAFKKGNYQQFKAGLSAWNAARPALLNAAYHHGVMAAAAAKIRDAWAAEVTLEPFTEAGRVVRRMCTLQLGGIVSTRGKAGGDDTRARGQWCTWP